MIIEAAGDVFSSGAVGLVNPVNCVGVSGAGLAMQFKDRFPANFAAYCRFCRSGQLTPGGVFVFACGETVIFNLATKGHWKDQSRLEWVDLGLQHLRQAVEEHDPWISSIAVPALGCGLGGLSWTQVYPLILKHLGGLQSQVKIIYP